MAYEIGYSKLNNFQKEILDECIIKKSGGLSLAMGSGKSLLGLVLALKLSGDKRSLIIMSKSLIQGWKTEIKKFFGDTLKYQILHGDYVKNFSTWKIDIDTQIVLTTSDVVSKMYDNANISNFFTREERVEHSFTTRFNRQHHLQHTVICYNRPDIPFREDSIGAELLFSTNWGTLIIDEIQKFTNIGSNRCKGISSISAINRWGLSGTMFDEPKVERILGYYLMLNLPAFPRNLPDANMHIRSHEFKGVGNTVIHRVNNDAFIAPKLNQQIIVNKLRPEEEIIYISMKNTMKAISSKANSARALETRRKFSSYLLALITYLRQCVISPLIPIANAALDSYNLNNKSELSDIIQQSINDQHLDDYISDEKNVVSSRLQNVLDTIDKHPNEKLVIFSSFRTTLDILKNLIKSRNILTLTANSSINVRSKIIDEFNEDKVNSILLLTYDIGSEGLNLQSSSTVLLVDLWWNTSKTSQAIARVLRQGQKADIVNVYYFTSNTAIENAIFEKQKDKTIILKELQDGPMKSTIKTIKTRDIMDMLENEENIRLINELHIK